MKKFGRLAICLGLVLTLALVAVGCSKADPRTFYTVSVEGGSGGGKYYENINCTVVAEVPTGKQFMRWIIDGEEVSATETFTFTVTKNVKVAAEFADNVPNVGKDAFLVTVKNNPGTGNYFSGTECTLKLANKYTGRNFKGWCSVNEDGGVGDVISTENPYKFTVTEAVSISAEFTDMLLATPDNSEDQMIKVYMGPMEFDRQASGTAFTEGVAYIKYHVFRSNAADAVALTTFKLYIDDEGAPWMSRMDGSFAWKLKGDLGSIYGDQGHAHNALKPIIEGYSDGDEFTYYFAAQAIGIDDGVFYKDSAVGAKGKGIESI